MPPKNKDVSIAIEGNAELVCYKHSFRTKDPKKWDKHCQDTKHTISGVAPCIFCKVVEVKFEGIPYVPAGMPPGAVCPACKEKYL